MPEELTNDEITVLMLSEQGQSVAAIARWQAPCDSLVAKGLLNRHDKFNHSITPAGREALKASDEKINSDFDKAAKGWFEQAATQRNLQTQARFALDEAARQLAILVKVSSTGTGYTYEDALRTWMPLLSEKVKEHLK